MKRFHTSLVLLFAVLLLNGCIGDDMDGCIYVEGGNLKLAFHYENPVGQNIFPDKIHKVNLFVFNQDGYFQTSQVLEQSDLRLFAGTSLNLQPGEYHIVCWGNAFENTYIPTFNNQSKLQDAYLQNAAIQPGINIAKNGDALYYAPENLSQNFTITIPQEGITEHTIGFADAHISIEVSVKGLTDKDQNNTSLPPIVELTDIPSRYNFEMNPYGTSMIYSNTSTYIQTPGNEEIAVATYRIPLFKNNNPMLVHIKKSSDQSLLTSISLQDFIADNGINIEGVRQAVIRIQVEYKQGAIEITVPDWDENPVSPEL